MQSVFALTYTVFFILQNIDQKKKYKKEDDKINFILKNIFHDLYITMYHVSQ